VQLSVVLIFVFFLSKTKVFRNIMLKRETSLAEKIVLSLFFGLIGILGTYNGLPVENTIANTRAVGVIVAGLVAGPTVGLGAGLVAGIYRSTLGGYTVFASSFSTIIEGVLAGIFYDKVRYKKVRWPYTFGIALVLEILHMAILVVMSEPLAQALRSVEMIGPPMIVINSFGVATFIVILESVYHEQEKIEATAAQLALKIANKTLPILRKGLFRQSAEEVVKIIFDMVEGLGAVAITTRNDILAFIGTGDDHHSYESSIITKSTTDVLEAGEYCIVQTKADIGCPVDNCPLASKVVVPLKEYNEVVGSLVLYKLNENSITLFEIELALGLAQLISTQIEISRGQRHSELLAEAEIRALQAQINPHFLFNAINTIVYYCRKDPGMAKDLLIHLGEFYRDNLAKLDQFVELATEIKHIDSYLKIEMARFRGRLKVIYQIPQCKCMVPPLILQPIVENAIKHGILPKKEGGLVTISGTLTDDKIILVIEDNGVGMKNELVKKIIEYNPARKNIGLSNVHNRLKNIYGNDYGLQIESWPGRGTRVTIPIPLVKEDSKSAKGTIG
jgi:two-component system sensor histidine kinase LytS